MDNSGEKEIEQSKSIRTILLGQGFNPFDPNRIQQYFLKSMVGQIRSPPISLDIGNDVLIPIKIGAYSTTSSTTLTKKIDSLTPFTPEIGYQIDSRDLELSERINKIREVEIGWSKSLDPSKASFILGIRAEAKDLNVLGLNEKSTPIRGLERYKFSKETLGLISRLRVRVFFPQGKYEAGPWELLLNNGEIDFRLYYPADSTPLATGSDRSELYEGFPIVLPPNLKDLEEIWARFALVDE